MKDTNTCSIGCVGMLKTVSSPPYMFIFTGAYGPLEH
jgi:hypothetical protein